LKKLALAYTFAVAGEIYLQLSAAALFVSLGTPCFSHGNSQECYGTSQRSKDTPRPIKVIIASVEFQDGNGLPEELQAQIKRGIKQEFTVGPGTPDMDWVNELDEVAVRGALQNAGYFKAQGHTTPYLIRAEAHQLQYAVRIEIESGAQYRIGEIRFADFTVFTQEELRKQVQLAAGEIFDVAKIRDTLDSIRRLYLAKGHIDVTIEPQMEIDDEKHQIAVMLKLSEEAQYRVGDVEILGVEEKMKKRLAALLEPGQIFDATALTRFMKENESFLPEGVSVERNVYVRRDVQDRTVDITVDVRPKVCSEDATQGL
jgi:outer membrane translocation and assembly module TamA